MAGGAIPIRSAGHAPAVACRNPKTTSEAEAPFEADVTGGCSGVYWFPQQKPTEVSMLKCHDSVTDGSVSRWSFHTACVDSAAPADARCQKNVVVRSFVFSRKTGRGG